MTIKIDADGRYVILASPDSNLEYGFDWSDWIDTDETITNSVFSVTNSAILSNQSLTSNIAKVYVHVITVNTEYVLTNTITTSKGKVDSRTLVIQCVVR